MIIKVPGATNLPESTDVAITLINNRLDIKGDAAAVRPVMACGLGIGKQFVSLSC